MRPLASKKPSLTSSGREILLKREIQGLRLMMGAYTLFVLAILPGIFFLTSSGYERWLTLGLMAISLLFVGLGFAALARGSRTDFVGFGMVILSLAVMILLPQIWYHSVGGDAWPHSYFLKTTYLALASIFIALSGLALRPRLPVLLSSGLLATWVGYIMVAAADSRTVWGKNFTDGVFGAAVDINILGWQTISLALVGIMVSIAAARARSAVIEAVSLEASNSQLSRYFSPNLVSRFQKEDAEFFRPGGKTQQVAVLFADIRSFTSLTEEMNPDEVLKLLSSYHQEMSGAIFAHGGTLDKFIGDGIMATFGTPEPAVDDALRAVKAGLEMKTRLGALNLRRKDAGLAALGQGIGVHYGPVLAGNIGTPERLEYTVLGDTVNVASRLENLCKEMGRGFLISGEVKKFLPQELGCINLGNREVKGRKEAVEVWALPGMS